MRRKTKNFISHIRGDDGAAMIIVLTIIFIMTTLGGVAILATVTNLRMSVKYTGWTVEYYALDREAERRIMLLDGRLSEAEGYAYEYMRTESYRNGEGTPAITGDGATDINEKAQEFIYNTWYNGVYLPSMAGASPGGAEILDENRYNNLFSKFSAEFNQRLYYFFAYRLIARDVRNGKIDSVEMSPAMAGFAGMLENYKGDPEGMKVGIRVSDEKEEYAKHIAVNAYVTAPIFGFETRTEDIPFKVNPVWTGALTARGSVRFIGGGNGAELFGNDGAGGGNIIRVYGDVYSVDYNEYYVNQNAWASLEGNEYGVASAGADVEIYGNVYSRGDLHIIGDGGRITVRRYREGYSAGYKQGVYGNTLYFNTTPVPVMIQRYTQPEDGVWDRAFIPFFYRDHLGGNVYCNNLGINESVENALIVIDNGPVRGGQHDGMPGVVWTLDDVQNDGLNSRIVINGNLIGISSDATFDDHTASSAVINTYYDSSTIELMGSVVTPGAAFMMFDGVNDMMDENTFFETAESISASNTAILNAYMEKPAYSPDVLYFYDRYTLRTERGISDFFLVNYESMNDKARHLINGLSGRIPDTGIVTGGSFEGYTRGAVIGRDRYGEKIMFGPPGYGEIDGYREIDNYADNYLAYSEIKDSLKVAFKMKTESFGAPGYKFGDLIKLSAILDPTGRLYPDLEKAITFMFGDSVYELDGEQSGIIYCAAAIDGSLPVLTIRGDGIFRGTIISEGDIYIEGAPEFHYDERLVSKILLYYPEIRDFFSPGEMGETSHVRIMGVSQGMKKLVKDRYKITDWTQWQD